MLHAEMVTDPIGGWGNLILQAGAFGLLVYIVAIIYPREAKAARDEREARDLNFRTMLDTQRAAFELRNATLASAIDKQTGIVTRELRAQTGEISRSMAASCRFRPAQVNPARGEDDA